MKEKELDYASFQAQYGQMFHLILYRKRDGARYVSFHDKKYSAINNYPLFYNEKRELCLATSFTIIFPKIYIRKYMILSHFFKYEIQTTYIQ